MWEVALCFDVIKVTYTLYFSHTHIYIHTQTTPPLFLISLSNSSLFTSDERGGGGREKWQKETEMRERVRVDLWVLLKQAL